MTDHSVVRPWHKLYDPGVPVHLEYPRAPLFAFLDQAARAYPERAGVVFEGESLSYAEVARRVDRLARALVSLGVKKGDRVGVFMPNIPEFVLAFYAILKAGGVVVAMNPQYKEREIVFQFTDAGVELTFVAAPYYPLLDSIRAQTGIRQHIVVACARIEDDDNAAPCGSLSADDLDLDDLLARPADDLRLPEVGSEDVAILQYTGGTTGVPKGAVGLHRNLVANTLQFRAWLSTCKEGQEVSLLAIPMYHVYGMVIGLSLGVALASTLVLVADPRNLANLLSRLETHRVTIFPGVPNLYAAIGGHPDVLAGKYNLRTIKACISGSAPLLKDIKDRFESVTGSSLREGYGLSEAPTATHCNPLLGENRAGSIGLPLPDVDCRIVDLETGARDVLPGEAGELIIRGPQVMQGYHHMPEETDLAIRDGWLYTGDIARMDADGYFYLIDRKKDLIKVGGFQVWSREVEEVIALHPAVLEVGVAGVPDPQRGEVVKAWVVLREGMSATIEEIRGWCARELARYKVPTLVEFRSSLPRTTVGKLLRRELVREHIEQSRA
jgi:long-chain acyl-CoA synthetase